MTTTPYQMLPFESPNHGPVRARYQMMREQLRVARGTHAVQLALIAYVMRCSHELAALPPPVGPEAGATRPLPRWLPLVAGIMTAAVVALPLHGTGLWPIAFLAGLLSASALALVQFTLPPESCDQVLNQSAPILWGSWLALLPLAALTGAGVGLTAPIANAALLGWLTAASVLAPGLLVIALAQHQRYRAWAWRNARLLRQRAESRLAAATQNLEEFRGHGVEAQLAWGDLLGSLIQRPRPDRDDPQWLGATEEEDEVTVN